MWISSIARIALSTSLAVAGGLSLVGVLASLPERDPAPAQPAQALPGPTAGLDAGRFQSGPDTTARPTPELARAIETAEALLAEAPTAGPASGPTEPSEDTDPRSDRSERDLPSSAGLARIAPAAGWPRFGGTDSAASEAVPAEQPAGASEAPQTAERLVPDNNADSGPDGDAVAGTYVASTIREGAQPAAATPPPTDAKQPPAADTEASVSGPAPASDPEAIGFVIIGSFQQQKNAARLAGNHRGWLPQILTRTIGGETWHRVAVGPFRAADLADARQRVIDSGIGDAWLLPIGKAAAAPARTLDILG